MPRLPKRPLRCPVAGVVAGAGWRIPARSSGPLSNNPPPCCAETGSRLPGLGVGDDAGVAQSPCGTSECGVQHRRRIAGAVAGHPSDLNGLPVVKRSRDRTARDTYRHERSVLCRGTHPEQVPGWGAVVAMPARHAVLRGRPVDRDQMQRHRHLASSAPPRTGHMHPTGDSTGSPQPWRHPSSPCSERGWGQQMLLTTPPRTSPSGEA